MITGVETAGLVLAVFPLLISALEHYREGFEPLKDWWKFQTEFVAFIHVIGEQSFLFDENLEELLSPIISSDAKMDILLRNPMGSAWRDPRLEIKLRARLPKSFEIYADIILEMKACVDKLQKKLAMQEGKILWINNHDSAATSRMRWEYEYRRIKHVLSRKSRGKIVRDLTSKNEELQKLFSSSERLSNYRVQRKAPTRFRRIREQASALYNVLEKAWKCQCTGKTPAHQANLLLENRNGTGGKKRGFHLEDSSEARLDILLLCKPETNRFPLSWRETEVVLLEPEEDCPTPSTASRSKPVSSDPTDSGTDIQWHPPLTTRSRKVKFPNVIIHPSAGAECRSVAALAQIHDLCSAVMHGHGINGTVEEPLGYLLDDQSRRHAFYPSTRPPVFTQYTETVTLGSLISQSRRPGEPDFEKTRLSRLERYSIAATLASSLLQLYNSPWVGESWSKNDIYFVKAAEGSPIFDRPYVTRRFKSSLGGDSIASGNKASIRDNSVKSIEALGIMLLELCFGEAIEDQPFRKKYLGAEGQPNDMTDFCTAKQWWENHALGEGGPDFHTAIRRCLFCAFAPKSTSLEDEELCAALYSEVVEPLESTVRHFTSEL